MTIKSRSPSASAGQVSRILASLLARDDNVEKSEVLGRGDGVAIGSNRFYLHLSPFRGGGCSLSRRRFADRVTTSRRQKEMAIDRITIDPQVMGGKPCIRGMRVTVGTIVGMLAEGHSTAEVLALHPYLEAEDIAQALSYAAMRSEEREIDLKPA